MIDVTHDGLPQLHRFASRCNSDNFIVRATCNRILSRMAGMGEDGRQPLCDELIASIDEIAPNAKSVTVCDLDFDHPDWLSDFVVLRALAAFAKSKGHERIAAVHKAILS